MVFNTGYEAYKSWLEQNTSMTDLTSIPSLRRLTLYLLLGRNYRVVTEDSTRTKLLLTYAWLIDLYNKASEQFGDDWQLPLLTQLLQSRSSPDENNLAFWLTGLTKKTADNDDVSQQNLRAFLQHAVEHCNRLFTNVDLSDFTKQSWLLLMAGAATLNIRGSQKSKVGKALERVFLKASLTLLGLEYNHDFWTAIPSDAEVVRETDAEVETRRGRIRMDMGLIAQGNPEVITDKVNRVGRNGIVVFDKIGARSKTAAQTAEQLGMKLIQIRHSQPLTELYRHLSPLVRTHLNEPPQSENELNTWVNSLPDNIFEVPTN